jgi:hypothetical protein
MPVGLSPAFAQFLDTYSVKTIANAAAAAAAAASAADEFSTSGGGLKGGAGPMQEATHFSLAGGKYIIPMHENQRFLRLYAEEWRLYPDDRLFFIERKTPFFRMHFDLDMVQPEAPTHDHMLELAKLFSATMRTYYNPEAVKPNTFVCIVLCAPSMPKRGWPVPGEPEAEAPIVQKTGYHMIWPFLTVDREQALLLRAGCVVKATQILGPREPPMNPYYDMIDKTVLEENGLRMVGSDKVKTCMPCKGKGVLRPPLVSAAEDCHWCGRSGRISERRVYRPDFVVGPDLEIDQARMNGITGVPNRYNCARFCSIRTSSTESTPSFKPPSSLAATCAALEDAPKAQRRRVNPNGGGSSAAVEIKPQTAIFKMVQDFLRTQMGGEQWAGVELSHFNFSEAHKCYIAKVAGEGSSYCMNVRRCHGSSRIFFVLKPNGVQQHCYSKKEGTTETKCKSYAGPVVKLTPVLLGALFQTAVKAAPTNGITLPPPEVLQEKTAEQRNAMAAIISIT